MDHVVFLEIAANGTPIGRIHIGLFHTAAPFFCENFHRLALSGGLKGSLFWKSTGWSLFGGDFEGRDGRSGKVETPEFIEDHFLPEDEHNSVFWPFACYATGAMTYQQPGYNDSNFAIGLHEHKPVCEGHFTCFGMVLKGFEVIEAMSRFPREPFPYFLDRLEVVDCGVSEYSCDDDEIMELQKRYHGARLKHFVATADIHRRQADRDALESQRKRLIEEKREQVKQELSAS